MSPNYLLFLFGLHWVILSAFIWGYGKGNEYALV
jgi:hypothetical protein